MDVQRDSILAKRDDDKDVQDKMYSKNKLLNVAMEENRVSFAYSFQIQKNAAIRLADIWVSIGQCWILTNNGDFSPIWRRVSVLLLVQNLGEDNVELRKKIEELREEMRDGREEMEKTADDYLRQKVAY